VLQPTRGERGVTAQTLLFATPIAIPSPPMMTQAPINISKPQPAAQTDLSAAVTKALFHKEQTCPSDKSF
jgi:hypothetical protein